MSTWHWTPADVAFDCEEGQRMFPVSFANYMTRVELERDRYRIALDEANGLLQEIYEAIKAAKISVTLSIGIGVEEYLADAGLVAPR